ncbi:epidermal growth factor receptor substrate 15-like isoform X2 [Phoenix dactylifera]|uniref:Epidermal growth factor receptor substrate 15-like isoform X2 n=1 Tax=Phoenix dactylifera TaxID=42345 RepID=A0A8B7D484_PHODC|nr:epidermal growth factor receptor substrate 15-like isoform X2 [Phoenix dactylifera]
MAAVRPSNLDTFDAYFGRADLDRDGRISGAEAVAFLQGSNLPKNILAQIWMHADQSRTGFLGRQEFYNALKLVTVAQSGRELTPDIVKSALYGPAAAKIPAPQINPVSIPSPQMNSVPTPMPQVNSMRPSSTQMGVVAPIAYQNLGFRGSQSTPNVGMNQQFSSNANFMRPPQATLAAPSLQMQGVNQVLSAGSNVTGPRMPSSSTPNLSTDWLGGRTGGTAVGGTSQASVRGIGTSQNPYGFGLAFSGMSPGLPPKPQTQSAPASSVQLKPLDPVVPSYRPAANNESNASVLSGNGFTSDSAFGGHAFSATSQARPDASAPTSSASSSANSSNIMSPAVRSQNLIRPGQPDPLQHTVALTSGSSQLQQTQSIVKHDQLDKMQKSAALAAVNVSAGSLSSDSNQSQLQWPRITQSDIQKYTAVFVEVDKDRDGKITGEQARNLFLSWRLPREVLKQVWDLSDQDNDSMLSLREFCVALYLMERYREGRPLPAVLPDTLRYDETLLRATSQPSSSYGGPAWQPNPGLPQQGILGSRSVMPATGMRPPMQTSVPLQPDGAVQSVQPKSRVPGLHNHLANQLSKDEQKKMNSSYREAIDADKKELDKQILDSKEKIEFYRTKMQDLVLYKSRCDNRLNEITERASAGRHEVESLAKKYEEKYKQVGELASKLAVEEATFRDIQERKLELYHALVKMEQGGSADGLLQVRADRIQSDLEKLEKALNERCKQHRLHVKPATSIELPLGWQPGTQEGAANWDEDWDKFEDEGFMVVKDLGVEVENLFSATNPKSPTVWSDKASTDEFSPVASSSNANSKNEKPFSTSEQITESGSAYDHSEEGSARSLGSPGRSTLESPFRSAQFDVHDISPRTKESYSDHGGAESSIFGGNFADESSWNFDDADSVSGSNAIHMKEAAHERTPENSFFGFEENFGLNPIKVGSPSAASVFGTEKKSIFFEDSVPNSPFFNSGSSLRFNEGREDDSFNHFNKFDSFKTHDSEFYPPSGSITKFDSISSSGGFGHSRKFESFDDAEDPFGSTGPFKSS